MPDADAVAELSKRLDAIIQGLADLRADLRDLRQDMQAGDAALRQEMQAGDAVLRQEIGSARREAQSYFRWTITTMVALFAVAVPIWIAVISFVFQRLLR